MTLPHAPDVQALLRSVRADVTALLEIPRQTPPPTTAAQPQRSKGPPPLPTPIFERARVVCGRSEVVNCPSRRVLDHVTSKWGVLVIVALAESPMRWGALRRRIEGVSEKMLAQTLRTLETDDFVLREAQPTIPPRVDYSLTPLGRSLADRLIPLVTWVGNNADEIIGAH